MKEQMKKVAKSAVKAHEAKMHKGAKKMAKGGYAKGGSMNEMRKMHGRNGAKMANQRGK